MIFLQFGSDLIQLEVINLFNDGSGLGFGIISGRGVGVIIKTIVPHGISDRVCTLTFLDQCLFAQELLSWGLWCFIAQFEK